MRQRVISGVIGSVLLVAALLAPPFVLMLVALAASLIAILEFRQAAQSVQREVDPLTAVIMTVMLLGNARFSYPESYGDMLRAVETWPVALRELGTLALSAAQFVFSGHAVRVVAFACILWLFGRLVFQHGRFHLDDLAMTITAVLYIPFLMSFVAQVRGLEHGAWLIWCVAIGAIITTRPVIFPGSPLGAASCCPTSAPRRQWKAPSAVSSAAWHHDGLWLHRSPDGACGCALVPFPVAGPAVRPHLPAGGLVRLGHQAQRGHQGLWQAHPRTWRHSGPARQHPVRRAGRLPLSPGIGGL
jgi:CDP-diglyceride synthetase